MYQIKYDKDGNPEIHYSDAGIALHIPVDPKNYDFSAFLEWNATQPTPLDWQTKISVPPPGYAELRRREYPPLADLADALYWMERKDKSLMEAWLAKCDAVKMKYPKP